MSNVMHKLNRPYLPYIASVFSGLGVCLAIMMVTGRKEAWDSVVYFYVGIPIMCALIFAISYGLADCLEIFTYGDYFPEDHEDLSSFKLDAGA